MKKLNKALLILVTFTCAAMNFTGCKKKAKIVYLNPFEDREYYTDFSENTRLSLVFNDDKNVDFITPDRGKIRDFTYDFIGEKCEIYLKSTGFYNTEGKAVSHKEFVEGLSAQAKQVLKSDSIREDYPEIKFSYKFDPEGDSLNKLELTQIYTDIDSATFVKNIDFENISCFANIDYDYNSSILFYTPNGESKENTHYFKSVERSVKKNRKNGTIRFECKDSDLVKDSESGERKLVENTHLLNTKFKIIQKNGETKMKLTFADGEYKGKTIILDFDPERIEFREGRWLNK